MKTTKSPHKKKFRFLLDAPFARPSAFTTLCRKANIKHIRHSYNYSPTTEDKDIYQLATAQNLIVITFDFDFIKLVKPNKAGAIIGPSYLSTEEIDLMLTKFISDKRPEDCLGKSIRI